jgi:hypothetical protein
MQVPFEYDGLTFESTITEFGSISTSCRIHRKNEISREYVALLSSILASKVVDLVSYWHNLPAEEKYPKPSFFVELDEELEDANIGFDEVLEEYSLKRRGVTGDAEVQAKPEEAIGNPRREEIHDGITINDALDIVESEEIESKESMPENVRNIPKEIVALANTHGGVLIIGMKDEDGELVGLENPRQVEERIAGTLQNIEPPVNTKIIRRSIADANLVIVSVEKAGDTPRSLDGKYYKRVGTTVQQMSPGELTRMIREEN